MVIRRYENNHLQVAEKHFESNNFIMPSDSESESKFCCIQGTRRQSTAYRSLWPAAFIGPPFKEELYCGCADKLQNGAGTIKKDAQCDS